MAIRSPLGTPEEVAAYLRKNEGTLANWRYQGIGPAYVKDNGAVLYPWAAVDEWIASKTVQPYREPRAA